MYIKKYVIFVMVLIALSGMVSATDGTGGYSWSDITLGAAIAGIIAGFGINIANKLIGFPPFKRATTDKFFTFGIVAGIIWVILFSGWFMN